MADMFPRVFTIYRDEGFGRFHKIEATFDAGRAIAFLECGEGGPFHVYGPSGELTADRLKLLAQAAVRPGDSLGQ